MAPDTGKRHSAKMILKRSSYHVCQQLASAQPEFQGCAGRLLDHRETAIHMQRRTRGVRRFLACKINDGCGDFG